MSISRMIPRSFVTNIADGAYVKGTPATHLRGIALGGATGVKVVDTSMDRGMTWSPAELGRDERKYSFRQWQTKLDLKSSETAVMVRCTNVDGLVQPATPTGTRAASCATAARPLICAPPKLPGKDRTMAISMSTAAHGAVILGGLTLFAIGHPAGEQPIVPTTPGLAVAPPVNATVAATAPNSIAAAGFTLPSTAVGCPTVSKCLRLARA